MRSGSDRIRVPARLSATVPLAHGQGHLRRRAQAEICRARRKGGRQAQIHLLVKITTTEPAAVGRLRLFVPGHTLRGQRHLHGHLIGPTPQRLNKRPVPPHRLASQIETEHRHSATGHDRTGPQRCRIDDARIRNPRLRAGKIGGDQVPRRPVRRSQHRSRRRNAQGSHDQCWSSGTAAFRRRCASSGSLRYPQRSRNGGPGPGARAVPLRPGDDHS